VAWLVARAKPEEWSSPSPIGFYFAKLWYFERLYPLIFLVSALGAAHADAIQMQPGRGVPQ
jgi:squalene-hopene/tetraprenyl-beta-curcumene cyclase